MLINTLDPKYDAVAYQLAKKLDDEKQEEFLLQYSNSKKNFTVALILWMFLGQVGAHRFYLNNFWGGIRMILSWVLIIIFLPLILWIIDIIKLSKKTAQHNADLANKCFQNYS